MATHNTYPADEDVRLGRAAKDALTTRRPNIGARRGFSLVEVLVAIAILTIGIIAFLELFPSGFFSLKVAANTSAADRLAQAELERLTQGNGANIQQIAAVERFYDDQAADGADFGNVVLDAGFDPDKSLTNLAGLPLKNTSAANTPTNQTTGFNLLPATNVGIGALNPEPYEYVSGEQVRIPTPVPDAVAGTVCRTLLDYGPVQFATTGAGAATAVHYPDLTTFNTLDPNVHAAFFVHGLPWTNKPGDSTSLATGQPIVPGSFQVPHDDPENELSANSPEFLIDYNQDEIALPTPVTQSGDLANLDPQTFILQCTTENPASGNATTPHTIIFQAQWVKAPTGTPVNPLPFWDPTDSKPIWASLVPVNGLGGVVDTAGHALVAGQPIVPGSEKLVRDFNMVPIVAGVPQWTKDPYEFALPSFGSDNNSNSVNLGAPVYLGELDFNPIAGQIVDNRGRPLEASVDYLVLDWHTVHEDRVVGAQSSTIFGTTGSSVTRLTLKDLMRIGAKDQGGNPYSGVAGSGSPNAVLVYDLDTGKVLAQAASVTDPYVSNIDYANGAVTFANTPSGTHVRVYYRPSEDWGLTTLKPAQSYQIVTEAPGGADAPTTTGTANLNLTMASPTYGNLFLPFADHDRLVQLGGTITYTDVSTTGTVTTTTALSSLVKLEAASGATPGSPCDINLISDYMPAAPTGHTYTFVTASPTVSGASLTVRVIWRELDRWRHRDVTTVAMPSNG